MRIIDISQELLSCAVYPGDSAPSAKRVKTVKQDKYNLTVLSMCVHNGTHIDAPLHFLDGGKAVHELPVEIFYGKCTVADASDPFSDVLKRCGERLLLKGTKEFSVLEIEALAQAGVRLIGIEGQTIGDMDVHIAALSAGIVPLEGLRLAEVPPGEYTLCAFPINIAGSDGAPVRAVLTDG
jgi:arylformamidase